MSQTKFGARVGASYPQTWEARQEHEKKAKNASGFALAPEDDYQGPAIAEAQAKAAKSAGSIHRSRLVLRRAALDAATTPKGKAYAGAYVALLEAEILASDRFGTLYEQLARGEVGAVLEALGRTAPVARATGTRGR